MIGYLFVDYRIRKTFSDIVSLSSRKDIEKITEWRSREEEKKNNNDTHTIKVFTDVWEEEEKTIELTASLRRSKDFAHQCINQNISLNEMYGSKFDYHLCGAIHKSSFNN
jgi:hypothetical protein